MASIHSRGHRQRILALPSDWPPADRLAESASGAGLPHRILYRLLGEIGYQVLSMLVTIEVSTTIRPEDKPSLTQRSAVVIANHSSYLDPVIVAYVCQVLFDRRLVYAGRRTVFRLPIIRHLAPRLGHVPIATTDPNVAPASDGSYAHLRDVLKRGGWVGLFPEGGIPDANQTTSIRAGFLRLATDTDAPIVALRLTGAASLGRRRVDWRALRQALLSRVTIAVEITAVLADTAPDARAEDAATRIFESWCSLR